MSESDEIMRRLDEIERRLRAVGPPDEDAPSSPEEVAENVAQTIRKRGGPIDADDGSNTDDAAYVEVVESDDSVYLISVSNDGSVDVHQSFTRS